MQPGPEHPPRRAAMYPKGAYCQKGWTWAHGDSPIVQQPAERDPEKPKGPAPEVSPGMPSPWHHTSALSQWAFMSMRTGPSPEEDDDPEPEPVTETVPALSSAMAAFSRAAFSMASFISALSSAARRASRSL